MRSSDLLIQRLQEGESGCLREQHLTLEEISRNNSMHGRIKVKSTEEQKEQKAKERAKKLQFYQATTAAISEKRKDHQFDQEVLELTGQILSVNPDYATYWNLRRQIFLHFEHEKEPEEVKSIHQKELFFLETCLRVNPKSYGTWHHRCWVMDHMQEPDWKRELELCNKFLEYDERNFHCWDYRRFVVQRSAVPVEEELAYTSRLISTNFSNYSSWHYRSTLLPIVHPDHKRQGRISEKILLKEYELVQNAFFTDPNDQSAWFYYRWLLGRADSLLKINCLYVNRDQRRILVCFSRPVNVLSKSSKLILFVDQKLILPEWRPVAGQKTYSCVWLCDLPECTLDNGSLHQDIKVVWDGDDDLQKECTIYKGKRESWCRDSATAEELFRCQMSVEKSTQLQSELESCKQLQELEPDNKWCLLTVILLMRALDPLGYENETLQYFKALKVADAMRTRYYNDLCSKFVIENCILKMEYAEVRVIDMSHKNLTRLCYPEQMVLVTHMNVSGNQLTCLPPSFLTMQCLEVLNADDNSIENISGLSNLPQLEEVTLRNNCIQTPADLQPLASCLKLSFLDLKGNPVCNLPNIHSELTLLLPQVKEIILQ
ncbi:geranylgeranyl transferase type-2 subunit alpha [Protopterus annectens]|uniref:geranylgeranyl transferase type-2 subunit alpha n=1 Tax=Protopterus annectens TaxID=7888 RepID=UPI001CF9AEC7|nr:geranylgeranyl transferase type-2 subunit alpha [Protopterus annectens]